MFCSKNLVCWNLISVMIESMSLVVSVFTWPQRIPKQMSIHHEKGWQSTRDIGQLYDERNVISDIV